MLIEIIFIAHIVSTFIIVGVIWYAQIALYPLMKFINKEKFSRYKHEYNRLIMPIATIMLSIELITAIALVWIHPRAIPLWMVLASLAILISAWLLTWSSCVPHHMRLEKGYNKFSYMVLLKLNLARAFLCTIRSFLVLLMIGRVI